MITIHEATAKDFSTLGLGALTPTECTVEEKAGGLYELTLTHPIVSDKRHTLLVNGRIIKAMAPIRETPLVEYGAVAQEREIYACHASNNQRLNMRTEPSLDAHIIHAYKQGTEVAKLAESDDGEWYRVAVCEGGATGWMWAPYLTYLRMETDFVVGDTPGGVVQPRQTREQLFRIYEVEPDSRLRSVTVRAQHISYDLKGAVIKEEYSPENISATIVCANFMAKLDHEMPGYHVYCAVTDSVTGDYGGRNLINCLLDPETGIVAQTGARVVRDNFDIFILPDEERDRGVELRYGKNLLSAALTTDCSGIVTRIQPVGKTKNGDPLYIDENNGFVDSENIGEHPLIYAKTIQYDVVESKELPKAEAKEQLKAKALEDFSTGCDLPTIRLDADFVRVEVTERYKAVANSYALHLYDKVPVIDNEAGILTKVRMIAYVYDCILDRYTSTTLGDVDSAQVTVYGYEIGGTISGTKIAINTMQGDSLRDLSVAYAKISTAAIEQLSADAIQAVRADIHQLVAGQITTDELYADLAKIAVAQITSANIESADIQWADIENLTAEIAKIANAEIGTADVDYAKIKDLVTGTAIFTEGVGGKLYVERLAVTEGNMVSLTVGELMVKAEDGGFKRLTVDADGNVSAQTVEVEGDNIANETISGGKLIENTITARELNVAQIFADEALIGAIKAANIDVANLFAAEATIDQLNSYIVKATTIEALEGALSLWADEKITVAVSGKLDADEPSVGVVASGITITSEQVKITSEETLIAIPDENGEQMAAQFDENGLTAQKIYAPNVAAAYDGPANLYVSPNFTAEQMESGIIQAGDAFRSLKEALAFLSYKAIPYSVAVRLQSNIVLYEDAALAGCVSGYGVTITGVSGKHATLNGKLELRHCLGFFEIRYLDVNSAASANGVSATGNGGFVMIHDCVMTGSGSGYGLYTMDGAKMYAYGVQMYDYAYSAFAHMLSEMRLHNNAGNCRIGVNASRIYASGTEPCDKTTFDWTYWYMGELRNANCTVDQGSGGAAPTTTQTTSWTATATGSYKNGGSQIRAEVAQGWYSGIGRILGCIWFDNTSLRNAISGKSVLNASLKLAMWKGVGRGTTVTVELAGTTAEAGASSASVYASYGAIGTAEPGETVELTLPTAAVTALANGTINGLALYSSDTGAYKERSYSKNYAVFDGASGTTKPVVTVTYQ